MPDDRPEEVHVGGCTMAAQHRQRTIPVGQARELLVQGIAAPCAF
ncbi:DUF6233 domain-containing protein [Streptomyces microflavus]